ncbi:MAG: dUTP diphosphatase [Mariprofundales bacterium]
MTNNKIKIAIQVLEHAQGLTLPHYASTQSAGLDLRAAIAVNMPQMIACGARVLIPSGIAIAIPNGFEAQIRPRSGLALKKGLTVLNAPGTIDADYRGELQVLLINLGQEDILINRGDRIAQLVFASVVQAEWELCTTLNKTVRNTGGFGSSGVQ